MKYTTHKQGMNTFGTILIVVLSLFVFSLFISALNTAREAGETIKAVDATPSNYPSYDEYYTTYMRGCSPSGGDAFCNCTYTYMIAQAGMSGIMETSLEYEQTGQLTTLMIDAVNNCAYVITDTEVN